MQRTNRLTALVGAVATLVPSLALAQRAESVTLTGNTAAIYALAGTVTLEPLSGGSVAVQVTRGGRDAAALRVERGDGRGGEGLRITWPSDRVVYPAMGALSSTTLEVANDGTFGRAIGRGRRAVRIAGAGQGTEAWADLRIGVPAGATVEVHLAQGAMLASNVDGRVSLEAIAANVSLADGSGQWAIDVGAGDVEVARTHGALRVATGSGAVRMDVEDRAAHLAVTTGSGDVTVRAPADLGARLSLASAGGAVVTDLPVHVQREGRDAFRGTVGDGTGTVSIASGSGQVRLLRQ